MNLKQSMKVSLEGHLEHYRKGVALMEEALEVLEDQDLENANFTASLVLSWREHTETDKEFKPVVVNHVGSLQETIRRAQAKFRIENGVENVHARYFVEVLVGEVRYPISQGVLSPYIRNASP
tara:strand:- start:388 stop:756 length:369 start_codon:yes stop_codon:yes gene_type:complete